MPKNKLIKTKSGLLPSLCQCRGETTCIYPSPLHTAMISHQAPVTGASASIVIECQHSHNSQYREWWQYQFYCTAVRGAKQHPPIDMSIITTIEIKTLYVTAMGFIAYSASLYKQIRATQHTRDVFYALPVLQEGRTSRMKAK